MATTIQSSIKNASIDDMSKYALFLGGTNVVRDVLSAYDPLKTGYGRIFMVHNPRWVAQYFNGTNKFKNFKHILQYGNTQIQGLTDPQVNFNTINGGYNGKSFEIPAYATDDTNTFSITCYEMSGSPIREVIHTWINGTTDLLTGLSHYNGVDLDKKQSNQTAEFIYVATDNTGLGVEYACMFANCFPRGINTDVFNYQSGQHELVETTIEFSCTKYESTQINKVAAALINRYRILTNSLNFNSGITTKTLNGENGKETDPIDLKYTRYYDHKSNEMIRGSKSGSAKTSVSSFRLSSESEEPAFEFTDMTTYQQMPHSDSNVR